MSECITKYKKFIWGYTKTIKNSHSDLLHDYSIKSLSQITSPINKIKVILNIIQLASRR